MRFLGTLALSLLLIAKSHGGTRTWDNRYSTEKIEVTVVYFVPSDRQPLRDWRERIDYYCQRIKKFHAREFGKQSTLETKVIAKPYISSQSTKMLRNGDADSIFFKTLSETDRGIQFNTDRSDDTFPILLVMSEINWRPLDDFFRLKPIENGFEFEGNYQRGEHFPGAGSGGARATYLADRGCGWGLVSADGWRVPYRGSDCVVYHEGCGHTVGLPHPTKANRSVMSMGQYRGWINESGIDHDQKTHLNWQPDEVREDAAHELFTSFRALPSPREPKPNQPVKLELEWPKDSQIKSLRVRYQTSIQGPWVELSYVRRELASQTISMGSFDRSTPVSYRVDIELESGESEELWGYFQVRETTKSPPRPVSPSIDLMTKGSEIESPIFLDPSKAIDLLDQINIEKAWSVGQWVKDQGKIVSPKRYGARIQLPSIDHEAYQMQLLVEPLDEPNALLVGNRLKNNRFATLFGFSTVNGYQSAIENIDGRNVGNQTTYTGRLFKKNRISHIMIQVADNNVLMRVDGATIVRWQGNSEQLTLSDYWNTPDPRSLFLGTYNCRFRFHQILLTPIQ